MRPALTNHSIAFLGCLLLYLTGCSDPESADNSYSNGHEWRYYGHDPGGMRYSPLDQINSDNVSDLEIAWTYRTGELDLGLEDALFQASFSATPLVIDGIMYLTTPSSRAIALNAESGEELWTFDPQADKAVREFNSNRGVAFWEGEGLDGSAQKRILYGTVDGRLYSLDAVTGSPDSAFGRDGFIDLRQGEADQWDFAVAPTWGARVTSPPAIYEHVVMVGWGLPEYPSDGPSGDVRAFDVRTGEKIWRFHTVPREGEYGTETWENDSWKDRMGANVWSIMSVDRVNGLVFMPTGSAAYDFYGGDRKGKNLFSNALVAVDALSGEMAWYYQLVHHDVWDYDVPSQPNLITIRRNGRDIPAVAQTTKMGFVFVFNRLTGEPLFPVEHRPVPSSEVPGEEVWTRQPFPVRPPPLSRTGMAADEVNDLTPEIYEYCRDLFDQADAGEIYTPVGLGYTITFPGFHGGSNWGGAAFDPETGLLYTNTNNDGVYGRMIEQRDEPVPYRRGGMFGEYGWFRTESGIPCVQPPWGQLHAIDMRTGEIKWEVPLGVVDELVELGYNSTGTQSLGGPIVTAGGLVFIGATRDRRFRAFDAETGEELWSYHMEAGAYVTPMTYRSDISGRQFVVVPSGGGGFLHEHSGPVSDELLVFALPE